MSRFAGVRLSRVLVAALPLLVVAAIVAIVLSGSTSSSGGRVLESWFQDDAHLVYSPTPVVVRTLDTLAGLGVTRLRVTILWRAIAPAQSSRTPPPGFQAANPAAYGVAWLPYDRIVMLAEQKHIGVNFDVTAPGPLWAMASHPPSARLASHYMPSAAAFGQFVTAVGRRYSGSYAPAGASRPLPRVSDWSVWNEPNQPGWLAPQWSAGGVMAAPQLYRGYVDAAFAALTKTGHTPSSDTFLIGELAPEGLERTRPSDPITPLAFIRALYCVDGSYQPLRGAQAAALGCPASPATFVAAHPGLFRPTGFAHHPYEFFLPPTAPVPDPNWVPLSELSRLDRALDSIFAGYGVKRRLPLYLTEYGYETNPPNPFRGVTLRQQSLYLNEAEYLAWLDPRVRALSQFQLYDSAPDRRFRPGSVRYWSTFQTGLLFANGASKPSLNSYRFPIVIPQPVFGAGAKVFIWAMLRPGPHDSARQVQIQWRPLTGPYRTVATVSVEDRNGFLTISPRLPGTGAVRLVWVAPGGVSLRSRAVGVQQS